MYLEFYGLREKPFGQTPDPRFLYWNDAYRETLASLVYGIRERKGFVAMIGEAGTGKTTLLRKLLDDLGSEVVSVLLFHPHATFDEILEYALSELGIPAPAGRTLAMVQRLNEFLLAAYAEGRNAILIIDEAQGLAPETLESLRLLSNLETSDEKILQIVLSGQPELAARLAEPGLRQLKQRIAVRCRLEPLRRDELAPYIGARLEVAGGRRDLFGEDTLEAIWAFSGGVPRLVNTVCDNALLVGYALGRRSIDRAVLEEVIADLRRIEPVPTSQTAPPADPRPSSETAPPPAPSAPAAPAGASASEGPKGPAGPTAGAEGAPPPPASSPRDAGSERPSHGRRAAAVAAAVAGAAGLAVAATSLGWLSTRRDAAPEAPSRELPQGLDDHTAASRPSAADRAAGKRGATEASHGRLAGGSEGRGAPPAAARQRPTAEREVGAAVARGAETTRVRRTRPGPADEAGLRSAAAAVDRPPPGRRAAAGTSEPEAPPAEPSQTSAAPPGGHGATVEQARASSLAPTGAVDGTTRAGRPRGAEERPPRSEATAQGQESAGHVRSPEEGGQEKRSAARVAESARRDVAPDPAPSATPPSPSEPDSQQEGPPLTLDRSSGEWVRVRRGDTLTGLSARRYGHTNFTTLDILRARNPGIDDIDLIIEGQDLVFPDPGPASRVIQRPEGGLSVLALTTPSQPEARALRDALATRFPTAQVHVEGVRLGDGPGLFRVLVGVGPDRAEALRVARTLGGILEDPAP